MQFINGIFYVSKNDLVKGEVMGYDTVVKAKKRHSHNLKFINNPNGTKDYLIEYYSLPSKYISIAEEKIGKNIRLPEFYKLQSLKSKIVGNPVDPEKIRNFILPNGYNLPEQEIELYIKAAKYLHFLSQIKLSNIKEYGFAEATDFYSKIIALIESENLPLPSSYFKLKEKVRKYKLHGACGIISKRFGQSHNSKIGNVEQAFIESLFARENNLHYSQVAFFYNAEAERRGWKQIGERQILNILKKNGHHFIGARSGISTYRDHNDFVISRNRPSRPNMLWVGDGTPFELYYQKEEFNDKGHRVVNYWLRKVVYVVIDAFNDCIIGYAIGDQENNALAKEAWKNACINTRVLPDQVKTDRYGLTEMRSFYNQLVKKDENVSEDRKNKPDFKESHFSPSAVGNARDKVVEQFFAKLRDKIVRLYPSHSGGNITSKEKLNTDVLNKRKHEFPDEMQVIKLIQEILQTWNALPRKKLNNGSLFNQWKNGDHSKDRKLSDMMRLEIFGQEHNYTNRLTNRGITPTLLGHERTYMLFTPEFKDTIGMEFSVKYDPSDLSKILCTANEGRIKFVVPEFERLPMAMGDMKPGDRTRLNEALEFKKKEIERSTQHMANNNEILHKHGLGYYVNDPEALLKAMPTLNGDQKQLLHNAENRYKQISEPDRFDNDNTPIVPVAIKEQNKDIFDED